MRTEMSRTIGGVQLRGAITVGALCQLHDRHGDMLQIARRIDSRDTRVIRDGMAFAAQAAGMALTDAENAVDAAIEEGGVVEVADFLQELLQHALTKGREAAKKPTPGQ